jgi:hypothetical protein
MTSRARCGAFHNSATLAFTTGSFFPFFESSTPCFDF